MFNKLSCLYDFETVQWDIGHFHGFMLLILDSISNINKGYGIAIFIKNALYNTLALCWLKVW